MASLVKGVRPAAEQATCRTAHDLWDATVRLIGALRAALGMQELRDLSRPGCSPTGLCTASAAAGMLPSVFRHEGPARSEAKNAVLAAYLALVGGYVNSAGFVLLGTFTSHVTGNVGRVALDIAQHDVGRAWGALIMIGAFFGGAVLASVVIESAVFRSRPNAYGAALVMEAALILGFFLLPEASPGAHRLPDSEAAMLCAAMGLQNSLVTRLSGTVVRTTHLTGVMTDLGIEVARWLRWGRATLARRLSMTLVLGEAERPIGSKVRLLSIIATTFSVGALTGAWAAAHYLERALYVPIAGIATAASYAWMTGRTRAESPSSRTVRG